MKYKMSSNYYLTDEEIADMRYESSEAFARKALGVFLAVILFGGGIVNAVFTLLGV